MTLTGQKKQVYDHLKEHGHATIVELRNALYQSKPDMKISEINFMYQKSQGIEHPDLKDMSKNLIINIGKKKNGEVIKGLSTRLTKTVSTFVPTETGVREEIKVVEV